MKKVISIIFVAIVAFCCSCCGSKANSSNSVIFDASKYSKISVDELVEIFGEPKSVDDWNNETAKGTFLMKIYDYETENEYLEFITHEDLVVKVYYFPNNALNLPKKKNELFKMFNIEPSGSLKQTVDTGYTWKFSPVSDKVAKVEIYDINEKEFGYAYFTYDLNYFEY